MKKIVYKCGCETYFEDKNGVYEVVEHGQVVCPIHTVESFNILYYKSNVWARDTKWFDHVIMKTPMDMMVIQEIINETKPDLIIETGTFKGGSALFMANMLDLIGNGYVITIENNEKRNGQPTHDRIIYWQGNSTDSEIVFRVNRATMGKKSIMVCLDSNHDKDNVLKEMEKYSGLVTVGNYLIVDDTNINNPMIIFEPSGEKRIYEQGPHEAVEEFLTTHKEFKIDRDREKFLFTFNPDGFLRKVADA